MKLRNIIKKYKNYNIFFIIFIIFIIMLGLCIYLSLTGSKSLIEGNTNEEKDYCKPRKCEDNLTKYTKCIDVHYMDETTGGLINEQLGEVVYHCPDGKKVELMTCDLKKDIDPVGWMFSICAPKTSNFSGLTPEEEKNIKLIQKDIRETNWKEEIPKFETPNLFRRFFS